MPLDQQSPTNRFWDTEPESCRVSKRSLEAFELALYTDEEREERARLDERIRQYAR